MARDKMSWDWVGAYPVFVYTTFIDHNIFNVKIVLGTKNNQNAGGTGPDAKPWAQYTEYGFAAKYEVVREAMKFAKEKLSRRTKLHPTQDTRVWGAYIKTPNGKFNPLVLSSDKKKLMAKAKEKAVYLKRMIYIKEAELR